MIVGGFIEPLVKELPMEYAVEMNRLIQLQMEGTIGREPHVVVRPQLLGRRRRRHKSRRVFT
ncbi:MAG UNVERIFIED_CONTAM: hypothetical protein LVT10_11755 [Anaerolineae bacterium]|jgi:hypothetical protein